MLGRGGLGRGRRRARRLFGRPVVDVDVACPEPDRPRALRKVARGAPFPLSERHGAWRVALADGRSVDFTPLGGRSRPTWRERLHGQRDRPPAQGRRMPSTKSAGSPTWSSHPAKPSRQASSGGPPAAPPRGAPPGRAGLSPGPETEELVRRARRLAGRPASGSWRARAHGRARLDGSTNSGSLAGSTEASSPNRPTSRDHSWSFLPRSRAASISNE